MLRRRFRAVAVFVVAVATWTAIVIKWGEVAAPWVPDDPYDPGAVMAAEYGGTAIAAGVPAAPSIDAAAAAACSSVLENPLQVMLVVQSGEATVAAAYEVTGDELATYLERTPSVDGVEAPSVWRDQPRKLVDMCIIDGDLYTQTPGPPGDRSAVRVLVVISDDVPHLWTIARKDKSLLPTTDPATME